jgi:uncharacterized phage-associated protein
LTEEFDARAVANLVLRESWTRGMEITNLKLQKLLFLCHAFFLVENGKRLTRGHFLAWRFGPVHREVYEAFQSFGKDPIRVEAVHTNPVTGEKTQLVTPNNREVVDLVHKIVNFYGPWNASELVKLTHARNGPWHHVVSAAAKSANMGLKISDDIIVRHFKFHWFGEKNSLLDEEPNDDSPLVA